MILSEIQIHTASHHFYQKLYLLEARLEPGSGISRVKNEQMALMNDRPCMQNRLRVIQKGANERAIDSRLPPTTRRDSMV